MERSLEKAAKYFGITRPKLIALMREKGLLNDRNLPAFPVRDREYLRVKDSNWYHDKLGMQYSQSTKVRQAGIHWLAMQLGLNLSAIPADSRDVA
jgi:phage antirepressor YoqD-like protein